MMEAARISESIPLDDPLESSLDPEFGRAPSLLLETWRHLFEDNVNVTTDQTLMQESTQPSKAEIMANEVVGRVASYIVMGGMMAVRDIDIISIDGAVGALVADGCAPEADLVKKLLALRQHVLGLLRERKAEFGRVGKDEISQKTHDLLTELTSARGGLGI